MRILITGSRDWDEDKWITIFDVLRTFYMNSRVGQEPTLVSGACPTGVDAMAEGIAEKWRWTIERHPADWNQYGKRAGFVRNAEMVKLGADVCLAFIKNNSKGATMTMQLAHNANIPTKVFRDDG